MPIMLSLDSLEVKPTSKRQPLCRTRTVTGAFPSKPSANAVSDDEGDNVDGSSSTPAGGGRQKKAPKPKKHVRFAEESENACHVIELIDLENSTLSEHWVLPEELREIKKMGFLACKEAKRTGLAGLLTEIYGTANDKDTQDRLNYWCRMASAARGLERFANEELSKRRNIYRKRAIVSVLEAQLQLKNEKGIDTANVLRRLSEAYTEQARVYAEKLGLADQQALQILATPPSPPPIAVSPTNNHTKTTAAAAGANAKPAGRRSRTERMKERAAATAAAAATTSGDNNNTNANGPAFRRNNTTMTAVVLQQ